jgi:hypothetical protein
MCRWFTNLQAPVKGKLLELLRLVLHWVHRRLVLIACLECVVHSPAMGSGSGRGARGHPEGGGGGAGGACNRGGGPGRLGGGGGGDGGVAGHMLVSMKSQRAAHVVVLLPGHAARRTLILLLLLTPVPSRQPAALEIGARLCASVRLGLAMRVSTAILGSRVLFPTEDKFSRPTRLFNHGLLRPSIPDATHRSP